MLELEADITAEWMLDLWEALPMLLRGSRTSRILAAFRRFIDEIVERNDAKYRKRLELERPALK
jgi:hypothetical protein